MIVEMAGRPAEHMVSALKKHVDILREVKDIEVHDIKVSEAKEIEISEKNKKKGAEAMFTAFAECDFEIPSFTRLSDTMFDFMPSSIEVIEPDKISMEAVEATALLNNISGRLHRYDEIAKVLSERHRQMEVVIKGMQKSLLNGEALLYTTKSRLILN